MRKYTVLLLFFSLLILVVGCSKEKKDEAAKLEQELLGDSQTVVDTDSMMKAEVDSLTEFEASAVPEEEPPKAMPEKPAGEGYTVQVAGCEDREYAEHLVEKYTNRGYEPYVSAATVESQSYYRVRIGIFENYSEAKALQAQLLDRYSLDTWIDVTVNNY